MKQTVLFILLGVFSTAAFAQTARVPIGPSLKTQLRQQTEVRALGDEARVNVTIYTSDADALVRAGVDVQARFGGFVTARLHPNDLSRVAALPGVRQIEDPLVYPENDAAAALVGVTALRAGLFGGTSYTGAGVFVCVIDSGIDWDHLDFRDPADPSQTRIHAIWDQTLTAEVGVTQPPFGFSYGVEYTEADIEAALAGGTPLQTMDIDGHGTHVAGTAAGNGASLSPARNVGMAPEAQLVVVKAGNGSFSTSNILNGMAYCDAVATAEGKPIVVNMSLGSQFGAHDGTDSKSVAASDFGANPGRVVVFSAGNAGADSIHVSGATPAAGTTSFEFVVPTYTPNPGPYNDELTFDLWFDGPGGVTARLITPTGLTYTQTAGGQSVQSGADGEVYLFNFLDPGNGHRRIYVNFADSTGKQPPAGTWRLEVTNNDAAGMGYHGWILDNNFGGRLAKLTGSDPFYTLSNTAQGAITVASYAHRWRWCNASGSCYNYTGVEASDGISGFSSWGPTRDGRALPHLAAPGHGMISTLSSDAPVAASRLMPGGQHQLIQGTSMASPVVAGAIALLMQEDPTLDYARTVALLQGAADADLFTGAVPNDRWGAGKLDAYEAMADLVGSPATGFQVRSYNGNLLSSDAITNGQALSVRFEHSLGVNGRVLGVLFHPSTTVSSVGTLEFGIFNDDGTGKPGTQIGSNVSLSAADMQRFTWNYLDLSAAAADLSDGTSYHIVLRAAGTSGNTFIRHDNTAGAGRSLKEVGGTWTAVPFDWGVRPIVVSAGIPLPVELVQFDAVRSGTGVALSWITASETNNAGFHVEAQPKGVQAWQNLGFVEGRGTRAEASRYSFTAPTLEAGSYRFRLRQVDFDGTESFSEEVELTVEAAHVLSLALDGPQPSPSAAVRFTVPRTGEARVEAYDALGRRVAVLFAGEAEAGRVYRGALDGVASGVYMVRIVQGGQQQTTSVVVAH